MNFDEFRKALTAYQMTGALSDIREALLELMAEVEKFQRYEDDARKMVIDALLSLNSLCRVIYEIDEEVLNKSYGGWYVCYGNARERIAKMESWLKSTGADQESAKDGDK